MSEETELTPPYMTTFLTLMVAREKGGRMAFPALVGETGLGESDVKKAVGRLEKSGWLESHADGYEITPNGGLAFYSLISGGNPPSAEL